MPFRLLLPDEFPELATLLPESRPHHEDVLIDVTGEVLAGREDHRAFPVLQVSMVGKTSPLIASPSAPVTTCCCRQLTTATSRRHKQRLSGRTKG